MHREESPAMMKTLTRIRLINWHYFINETIRVNGSFLISGENTSGKSTVLDAIQLVLTTNYRKFNTAANEKSSRDLKGYVRCKTGNEDSTYMRKGSVITYVALEFYEERTAKYFTLGVKIDSPDEESKLTIKWFNEESRLEELSFITSGRPSTSEEFRKNDKKLYLIAQASEARSRFDRRMGNVGDRFFEMIPKSLAFKPMDNVKDFINRFILSERAIQVETLRHNIATLKELEELMALTKEKISDLQRILAKQEDIIEKDREIKTNEVMIRKAEIEAAKLEIEAKEKSSQLLRQKLEREKTNLEELNARLKNERARETELQVALGQNETLQLIRETKHRIEVLNVVKNNHQKSLDKLNKLLKTAAEALILLQQTGTFILSKEELLSLGSPEADAALKSERLYKLRKELDGLLDNYSAENFRLLSLLDNYTKRNIKLTEEIRSLKNKKMLYPDNTTKLTAAVEKEFLSLGIQSEPRIFSDLLEITDPKWQDAVEGYLNTKRFYVIVEPQYYSTALGVYDRIKKDVHTVGLVNNGKLDVQTGQDISSLAYVIKSDNRWARAYAVYLLNRVIRCDDVLDFKNHKVAITPDCMLYQNYAVRKIDERVYETPYIGSHAFIVQLKNKQAELEQVNGDQAAAQKELDRIQSLILKLRACNMAGIEENLEAPSNLKTTNESLKNEKTELKKAEQDPSFVEIQFRIEECSRLVRDLQSQSDEKNRRNGSLKTQIETNLQLILEQKNKVAEQEAHFSKLCASDLQASEWGLDKFKEQIKLKAASTIVFNFSPLKVGLQNKKNELVNDLIRLQLNFCNKNNAGLGSGIEAVQEYVDEHHKLVASDIIKYEGDLEKAKENCHLEFRESFLAKLKENIEEARTEFKNLNGALRDIYYGEDSYKFELTFNKKKENIYQMITSNKNELGFNLWSQSFDSEYKEEMEDLFAKLTAYDDKGENVLSEYTDYRGYLDYDIIVEKRDGTLQRFSKIYGEKSGGETQTPYYVAIAASFVQLYKGGDTIRIIMFDEAFDKMDDNRISSMMDFLNSQKFQIILATPPAKLEVIGEKVDTILMAMREGSNSIIEEYDL